MATEEQAIRGVLGAVWALTKFFFKAVFFLVRIPFAIAHGISETNREEAERLARIREDNSPLDLSLATRFEHTHIVAGTGHGKTQLLQSLILADLPEVTQPHNRSVIVIDSQGDLIKKLLSLGVLADLGDRFILIDPNDIAHPPSLNLFDFGLDRVHSYDAVDRERLVNGAISLYEYLFGALLGADLTARQGMIFRYLARLMMVVPGANIHTLMQFVQEPEVAPYLPQLDRVTQSFFQTQFFSPVYNDTRQQISTRLWMILSNMVLAEMFSAKKNAVDLYTAMNNGSLILINTAKDLLKQEGCELMGRFFIALIAQATQERAILAEDERTPTFLYIDEAQDYFDAQLEGMLNQARKYNVGITLAHQNLDQFDSKLRATVMASTTTKYAGGLSGKDRTTFAKEFNCDEEEFQQAVKGDGATSFITFVKNQRAAQKKIIQFGLLDKEPKLTDEARQALLQANRERICHRLSEENVRLVKEELELGRAEPI